MMTSWSKNSTNVVYDEVNAACWLNNSHKTVVLENGKLLLALHKASISSAPFRLGKQPTVDANTNPQSEQWLLLQY